MIEVTERAIEGLRRMTTAARRFDPGAGIRLAPGTEPGKVGVPTFLLAAGPESGDVAIEGEGYVLWVDASLGGTVDLADHDLLVLRPGGTA